MEREDVTWQPLSIDLEWGKLSGKSCIIGNPSGLRILGLHGWLDNANSFDTLAPYLPRGTELLVLDLPGHGLSDHLPPGAQYDILSYILHVKRAVDKCGWDKFILIGHSMGACVSNIFTALFPKQVTALVSLEYIQPKQTSINIMQQNVHMLFKGEQLRKQEPIVYSEEEAIERLIKAKASFGFAASVDNDAAYILLPRSARQVEGGYVWTHDPRARPNFQVLFGDVWHKYISSIKCPVMIITASQGIYSAKVQHVFSPTFDIYRNNAKWFNAVKVDGSHHVHLTHPERVAEPLLTFIQKVVKDTVTTSLQARL